MTNQVRLLITTAMLLLATPWGVRAQAAASERAVVSQTVDGTTITIDYARPRVRNRGKPFGDIVSIGDHRWTPGANWATMITSDKPFTMNGKDVPEGTWSMWIDLEEDGWSMILDPEDSLFHTFPPEDSDEQIRFPIEHRGGPFVETMLFWVPQVRLSGFDLILSWGTTQIPFEIGVEPTFTTIVAEEEARELEGDFNFAWVPPEDAGEDEELDWVPFEVVWQDEHLEVASTLGGPDDLTAWLIPLGAGYYHMAWVEDGEVWEILTALGTLEVVRGADDGVLGFDLRAEDDTLWATIRRADGDGP